MAFVWNHYSWIHLIIDIVLVAVVAAALLVTVRVFRVDRESSAFRVLAALALASIAALLPVALLSVLIGFRGSYFFLARALWIVPSVGVPVAVVVLSLRYGVRRRWLWFLVVLLLAFKLFGEVVEPRRLEVEHITLELAGLDSEVRAVHLSDLQTDGIGSMHLAARQAANDFEPHLLLFTGDLLNHSELIPQVSEYLRGFQRERGFAVGGNVDSTPELRTVCRESGMTLLDGRAEVVRVGGSEVAVLGQAQWR